MKYQKINNLTGWIVFAISAVVYLLTIEPTVSLWDCGEYITTANKLEVGHPPGAPTFMMLGRVFSAFVSPENVALMVNAMSGLSSAFGILFLFWTITYLAKKIATRETQELSKAKIIAIMGSGIVGALGYTFTDSYWFNAVEGEVYAMSSFLTAITFWAALKWEAVADEPTSNRWLVLIMFIIGLSIGVHLLNLLAIPAIAYIYYFKKYEKTDWKGFIIAGVSGIILLGIIQAGIIPKTPELAASFERFSVNSLGLPLNMGTLIFSLVLFGGIVFGIFYTHKNQKVLGNTILVSLLVLFIGYSSFAMIVVRSNSNTPLDENNPETLDGLVSYLNRDQYGSQPISYGQYFNSPIYYEIKGDGRLAPVTKEGYPTYLKVYSIEGTTENFTSKYLAENYCAENNLSTDKIKPEYVVENWDNVTKGYRNSENEYHPDFMTIFPRMYFRGEDKVEGYKNWSNYKGKPVNVTALRQDGATMNVNEYFNGPIMKPTMGENFTYFFNYQVNWMYLRYFMWNFSGRQTDQQGHDYNTFDGQWISGLNFIDSEHIGNQEGLPDFIAKNKAHNTYFMIPLLFGLIGLVFQLTRAPKDMFIVSLLFLFTGLAIVLYLNQKPVEPRERDYAYAGSFYAFAIWIGLSVYALFDFAKSLTKQNLLQTAATVYGSGIVVLIFEILRDKGHVLSYTILFLGTVGLLLVLLMQLIGKRSEMASSVLATVLGLSVPIILAAQNWDDHSRADRYTAKAFAFNYLNSCGPNGILFTNGDNDTFPLWYAQEVEGERTDLRVANLSLLSTDWHVAQMKRKAYDSEPLPLSLPERAYRPSVRNIVEIQDNKSYPNKYFEAKKIIDFIADDSKMKESRFTGQGESFSPARKVFVKVNKENVKKWLPEKWHPYIQDTIKWNLAGNYMFKSDLAMLDLLANYDWSRPIYFASTSGMGKMSGLKKYTVMEGFTYMLVPVEERFTGGVNTDDLYNRLLADNEESFIWGNLENPDVYIDNYTLRMTHSARLMYFRLAEALLNEGKKEKAVEVLDRCLEVMPQVNVPFHSSTSSTNYGTYFGDLYKRAGEDAKANDSYVFVFNTYKKHLEYFSKLKGKFISKSTQEIVVALKNIESVYNKVNDEALKSELEQEYKTALEIYVSNIETTLLELNKNISSISENQETKGLLNELKNMGLENYVKHWPNDPFINPNI